MRSGLPGGLDRRVAFGLAVPAGLLGVLVAWALGDIPAAATMRLCADLAGAAVLGLAALPRLNDRLDVPWRMLAVLAGLWCCLEFAVLVFAAGDVVGSGVTALTPADFGTYLVRISGGQIGLAILAGTAVIAGYSVLAFRRPGGHSPDLVLVFAAVTVTLRPITGHMSQQVFGSVLAGVHALAAAIWLGLLLALALVVRGRRDWAETLPRYSAVAVPMVAAVAVTGVINGVVRMGGITPFFTTGYGRIMVAKSVLLIVLLALGWWWRRSWVAAAAAHRMSAEASLRRAVLEVAVMAAVFGLAASLAVAG
ncbi:CopD family protein [Nocardia carnea]|uniref:CopD family protein n=1 Tax=Nocardia carnea TaxID=37328 RepID=UPI002454A503|nr:CopD family protein [Nocardia carnea]